MEHRKADWAELWIFKIDAHPGALGQPHYTTEEEQRK